MVSGPGDTTTAATAMTKAPRVAGSTGIDGPFPGIAGARRHHQTGAILVLNLLLGWTLLGWIAALVWAFTATPGKP